MLNCYVIDDEQYGIDTLSRYISDTPQLQLIGSSTNPLTALTAIKAADHVDIVFLDIEMPELSGIELAKLFPPHISVIFTTAHSKFAIDGYELEVTDFLLKPVSFGRFLKAVEKVTKVNSGLIPNVVRKESLFINPGVKGKVLRVKLLDVKYVEGLRNYVIIHSETGKNLIAYLTMIEIETSFPSPDFLRIHKSYLVNMNKIDAVEGNRVKIGEDYIPIGSNYKDNFMDVISKSTVKSKR